MLDLLRRPRAARLALLLGALALAVLYALTLLPGVGGGDTAEFQRVGPTLGLAHSTGYPLYSLLGWAWSHLVPWGSPARRMSALSLSLALLALLTLAQSMRLARLPRLCAALAALSLGLTSTFWQAATQAEIYAMAMLLQAAALLALLLWRAGRAPLALPVLLASLAVSHHRTSALLAPGALVFVAMSWRPMRWSWSSMLVLLGAALLPWLAYAYVPWRAAAWQNGWELLHHYLLASSAQDWLDWPRLLREGWSRPLALLHTLVLVEWTPPGLALGLLGFWRCWRNDRPLALLALLGYTTVLGFCCAYYVPDLAVFFLPAQLIHALLLGYGLAALDQLRWPAILPLTGLLLLALLLRTGLPVVRAANTLAPEQAARLRLAGNPAPHALVIGPGFELESLRYLQAVEGLRPDLEYGFNADPPLIHAALQQQRPVYLITPDPALGLAQQLEHELWRVGAGPLAVTTPLHARWHDGLALTGASVPAPPLRPGTALSLILRWDAWAPPQQDYTRFVHLVAADGQLWGQADAPPPQSTSQWQPGTPQLELVALPVDPAAPPGTYRLEVGWYRYPPLQPLARADASGEVQIIGTVQIAP